MLLITLIIAAFFGIRAAAVDLEPALLGYTVVPMSWHAMNTTDGSDLVLHGTIQEIDRQLEAMDDVELNVDTDAISAATNEQTRSLATRSKDHITCWVGGSGAVQDGWLEEGIDYLKRHERPCGVDPGPGTCVRVSCSFKTAIWLCNDDSKEVVQPCAWIATYVEDIRDHCTWGLSIQGTEYDTDLFNVVVGRDMNC